MEDRINLHNGNTSSSAAYHLGESQKKSDLHCDTARISAA